MNGSLICFHSISGNEIEKFEGHIDTISCCIISHDNKFLFSGSYDNSLKCWNIGNGKCRRTYMGHTHWISDCNMHIKFYSLCIFNGLVNNFFFYVALGDFVLFSKTFVS